MYSLEHDNEACYAIIGKTDGGHQRSQGVAAIGVVVYGALLSSSRMLEKQKLAVWGRIEEPGPMGSGPAEIDAMQSLLAFLRESYISSSTDE